MEEQLSFRNKKIVADAGYESEENYGYLEKNRQISFIKSLNYELSKTRKYQTDIGRIENMGYERETTVYSYTGTPRPP